MSDNAQCNENDLCSYVEEITQQSMNITALEGVPVINQTTIPDWKNYEFTLINNAAHGTVLPGPGIQFLYGPDEGYTGNDQFTFQYSQNGQPRGIMTVNVTISPIPVIPVPNEGGEY
ncbi:MAG: Ig-like domain-containing protein [Methanobacterium sp. ERen5]|nr:MAG: Ig-like domain-containing protein [Methanobacterium sp. ERen5]